MYISGGELRERKNYKKAIKFNILTIFDVSPLRLDFRALKYGI